VNALSTSRPVSQTTLASPRWRRAVLYGVLWAVAISVLESFALPLGHVGATQLMDFVAGLFPRWCVMGIILAVVTMLFERRLTWWSIAPTLLGFSVLVCAAWWFPSDSLWPMEHGYLHIFWGGLFYGGVFVAAYRVNERAERTRRLFGRAEIARQRTESLLSAAQLRALQGHIDPTFLLRVMVEVERRYTQDARAAGALLDAMVSFLRAAMPGVRGGASTLAVEVQLAMQYAQVWAELEPRRPAWRLSLEGSIPDVQFPSLLLLPVLDRLASSEGASFHSELSVRDVGGKCELVLDSAASYRAPWLEPDLMYRLQVGLRTMFGEDWVLAVSDTSAAPKFVLTLPFDRPAHAAAVEHGHAPLLSTTDQEMGHG